MSFKGSHTRTTTKGDEDAGHRKGVTFHPRARMRLTIALDDFTDDEVQSYWYSKEEIEISRAAVHETIQLLRCNLELDTEHHCQRGLETAVGDSRRVKQQRRRAAADIVFSHQEEEWMKEGQALQMKAAEEYSLCCKSSHITAYMVGVADAYEERACCYGKGKRRTPPSSLNVQKWK